MAVDDVWYVDDDAALRGLARSVFSRAYEKFQSFEDGALAYAVLQKGEYPRLLVTDLNMPGMKGTDLIQGTRELVQKGIVPEPVKFLLVSGGNDDILRDIADVLGITCLPKPYAPAQLLAEAAKLLPPTKK
jgi:CheY-like chemotaxis protein